MIWWNGDGAARVLGHAEDAILMERAEEGLSLADLARDGRGRSCQSHNVRRIAPAPQDTSSLYTRVTSSLACS